MAFSPPEYCRLFAQENSYQGGVTSTPGPPPPPAWATPLRLGREPFNWADMSCSIRVRIVYESWSRFIVSSIKSSVQKTSAWTHRLLAADIFCKKDENPFCFFPWQCFAVAFSLKALLHFKVFKIVTQGNQRLEPVHLPSKYCRPKNKSAIQRKIIISTMKK